ncbi:MAG: plasmid stabilization system protein [Methylibium sp. NZG]|nr:MAG: plasmid stabilization system protein [Methylibium sp. NZG]
MKACVLRPQARADRRSEVRYYRDVAGTRVAAKLIDALEKALDELERNPGIGSPVMGQALGVEGMRTWLIAGFPLSLWYFERATHVDVVRLVGHRQDANEIEVGEA